MDNGRNPPGTSQPKRSILSLNLVGSEETSVTVPRSAKTKIPKSKNRKHHKLDALLKILRKDYATPFKEHFKIVTGCIWDDQAPAEKINFVKKRCGLNDDETPKISTGVVESWDLSLLGKAFRAIKKEIDNKMKQCPETMDITEQINKINKGFRNLSSHVVLECMDETELEESYQKLKVLLMEIGYDEKDLEDEVSRLMGKYSPCYSFPKPNECFSGRNNVVKKLLGVLNQCLEGQRFNERSVVITGLMGMGKSEVAIQLADKLRSKFELIFWFDAETKQGLDEGFKRLWNEAFGEKPLPEDTPTSVVISEIYRLIHVEDYKSLFIFDNAEALKTSINVFGIEEYLRDSFPNKPIFVITSRNVENDWSHAGFKCHELGFLSKDESFECLLKHLRLERLDVETQPLKKQIESLVEELDGLSLGLHIIGSEIYGEAEKDVDYLNRCSSAITQYTKLLTKSKPQELPGQDKYATMLGTIFNSVMEKIKKKANGEASEHIINIVGLLSADRIYLGLVHDIFSGKHVRPEWNGYENFSWENLESDDSEDTTKLRRAMNILTPSSLIKREKHNRGGSNFETIKVHRMVQQCVRKRLSASTDKTLQLYPFKGVLKSLDSQNRSCHKCWDIIFENSPELLRMGNVMTNTMLEESHFSDHIHSALSYYFSLRNPSEDLPILQVLRLILVSEDFRPTVRKQLEEFLAKKEGNVDALFLQPLLTLIRNYINRNDATLFFDDMERTLSLLSPYLKKEYLLTVLLVQLAISAWNNNKPEIGRLLSQRVMKLCRKRTCEELSLDHCTIIAYSFYRDEPNEDWSTNVDQILDAYDASAVTKFLHHVLYEMRVRCVWYVPIIIQLVISSGLFKRVLLAIPETGTPFGGHELSNLLNIFTFHVKRDVEGVRRLMKASTNLEEALWHATEATLDPRSPQDSRVQLALLCSWCALFRGDRDFYSQRGPVLDKLVTNWLDTPHTLRKEWEKGILGLLKCKEDFEVFREAPHFSSKTKLWINRIIAFLCDLNCLNVYGTGASAPSASPSPKLTKRIKNAGHLSSDS